MTLVDEPLSTPNATTVLTSAAGNPIGFGRMLRKEDVRFVRGKGNYIDDVEGAGHASWCHPAQSLCTRTNCLY